MTNVWLGDFRCNQLRYWQEVLDNEEKAEQEKAKKEENLEDEEENIETIIQNGNIFIVDDAADISWFESVVKAEIAAISGNANIIFNLGFNDCLGSCTWKSLDIKTIATEYIKILKELTELNNSLKFYFCAVNPVDAACPGISYKGELIPAEALNKKIEVFNDLIKEKCIDDGTSFIINAAKEKDKKDKEKCNIIFIDSYDYFKNTSYNGRDSKYYSHETCLYMLDFVKSYIRISSGTSASIIQRTEAPAKTDTYYFEDNVYYQAGWGMPNCTCYAWGRFFEILGEKPKLFTGGDAEMVFGGGVCLDNNEEAAKKGTAYDGYDRGQTPQVGAVMCWENTSTSRGSGGHVAIVEEVISPTEVKTSESEYGGRFWVSLNRKKGSDGNWGMSYRFQGFIYNPKIIGGGSMATVGDYVTKAQVTCTNESLTNYGDTPEEMASEEMKINARYLWQYLGSHGWTLNAVAGMLGNMVEESSINAGVWEGWDESYAKSINGGCGLIGWTPWSILHNWCDKKGLEPMDMDSQLQRIQAEVDNGGILPDRHGYYNHTDELPNNYPSLETLKAFSTSTASAYDLAFVYLVNYERPRDYLNGTRVEHFKKYRGDWADFWFEYLLPFAPGMAAPMSLVNLKIDNYKPTKVKGSFVVRNGEKGICRLFKSKDKNSIAYKKYSKKALTGIDDNEKEKKTASGDITKVLNFEFSNLVPDTEYKVVVEISKEDDSETVESEIIFTTPQDYPEAVSNISLEIVNNKFPNDEFKLTCDLNKYWGYWKKNDYGYNIQLLVNGQYTAEKTLKTLNNSMTFVLNKFFNNYKSKLDDTIQIGIQTWVTASKNKKIYNLEGLCASNSICRLKQPFITYLNTEKYK